METLIWYHLCALTGLLAIGIEGKNVGKYGRKNPISQKLNDIGKQLLYGLRKEYPGQSVAVIPGPIFNLMGQLSQNYTKGKTYEAITDVVGSTDSYDTKTRFKESIDIVNESDLTLRYASRLYADDEYKFCPAFKKSYAKYFQGTTGNANFDYPDKAAKKINEWLDYEEVDQTGNADLVNASVIKKDGGFILVSSVEVEFDYNTGLNPRRVKPIYFYSSPVDKRIVPALYGTGIVKYAKLEKYDAQFIGISLTGNFTFFIILPNKIDGLEELLEKIENVNVFEEVLPIQEDTCVELTFCLGKLAAQNDLTEIVKKIGNLDILFDKKRAEFSGITENCEPGVLKAILSEIYVVDKMVEDNNYNEMTKPNIAKDICANKDKLIKVDINHPFTFAVYSNGIGSDPPPVFLNGIYY